MPYCYIHWTHPATEGWELWEWWWGVPMIDAAYSCRMTPRRRLSVKPMKSLGKSLNRCTMGPAWRSGSHRSEGCSAQSLSGVAVR